MGDDPTIDGDPDSPDGASPGADGSVGESPRDDPAETRDPRAGGVSHSLRSLKGVRGDVALPFEDLEQAIAGPASEGRYAELGEIARGGMGAILQILDTDIRRPVAMKVVLGEENRERLERFVEEAQVTGQLEHPNIVPVHELGLDDEGRVYFTMKLVKGKSLEEIIEEIADAGADPGCRGDPAGRPYKAVYPLSHLLQIYLKVCDAVAFAHSRGVIHRDLKPENVMVGRFGEVLVMDWGLAKVKGRADLATQELVTTVRSEDAKLGGENGGGPEENSRGRVGEGESGRDQTSPLRPLPPSPPRIQARTLDGDVFGTPAYMPPEQAAGKIDEVDPRSDVFSLGAILYKLLTHEAPYSGASVTEVLRKAMRGEYLAPRVKSPWRRIPKELQSICLKAMQWRKNLRYGSVEALIEDVRAYQDHRPVRAHRYGILSRFVRVVRRHPAGSMAGGVAVVLLSIGAAVTGMLLSRAETIKAREAAQKARADAEEARAAQEKRRADDAVVEKDHALGRADTAEAMLEKGRRVSAVLRSVNAELGEVLKALKRSFYSARSLGEKRKESEPLWERIDAFERTQPGDSASKATWLAVKGWFRHLAGFEEDSRALFRRSRETDGDVVYGWLFESMVWLSAYLEEQQLPLTIESGGKIVILENPPETKTMKNARTRFVRILDRAKNARVWGESATKEFDEVLGGFRAFQSEDMESAARGLARALALPETALIRDEVHLALAKVRFMQCAFDEALRNVREVLGSRPESAFAHYLVGAIESNRGSLQHLQGEDPRRTYADAFAAYEKSRRLDPRFKTPLAGRGLTGLRLGSYEEAAGLDPRPTYRRAIEDFEAIHRFKVHASFCYNLGDLHLAMARSYRRFGDDPGPWLEGSVRWFEAALEVDPEYHLTHGVLGTALSELGNLEITRGQDPRGTYRRSIEFLRKAAER
ncbi:MAG: protein kinase domain-containing protein, partial [Planctomycetota bacterium]